MGEAARDQRSAHQDGPRQADHSLERLRFVVWLGAVEAREEARSPHRASDHQEDQRRIPAQHHQERWFADPDSPQHDARAVCASEEHG
ncbi:hypothetical protein D3C86_1880950 [compost metagenome]